MRVRKHRVYLHLNDKEYAALNAGVARSGLSRESYLRMILQNKIPKPKPPPDYHTMMKEIRAVGINLNQIAAKANAIGFIDAERYDAVAKQLLDRMIAIQKAVCLPEKISVL